MRRLAPLPLLAALALASPAAAQVTAVTVPSGRNQQALALRVEGNAIRARVCEAAGCTPDGGAALPLPDDVKALATRAKVTAVVRNGHPSIAHVEIPGEAGASWRMLIAAPLKGKGSEPVVVWSGWTGVSRGEHGEERSAAVILDTVPDGRRVLIGEHRADVTLCGRPTLVGAREINPDTLELGRAASVQNLSAAERSAAPNLLAVRATAIPIKTDVRVLRATAASSAVEKKLWALTDGDVGTAWSEAKPGDGRGEFVSMSAPDEVAITGIDLAVRPTEDVPDGAAPKRIYIATASKLFAVSMPEDAWHKPPGTRYTVMFNAPEKTSCLAVVLDESYAPAGKTAAKVSIAEIEAHTAFDGATPEALAGALAGGGERAKAAAAMLARAGEAGMRAAIGVYDKLDEDGRRLAASVVDAAPCKDQVPFFAARFAAAIENAKKPAPGEGDPDLLHARDRLRRCGRTAAEALKKLVIEGTPRAKMAAAEELAALAPDVAVPALLDAMDKADDGVRRELRTALARAAKTPRAIAALSEEVAKAKAGARSEIVTIDLLRAIGPVIGKIEGAGDAFAAVEARSRSFRGRYLLVAPAAELARAGHQQAEAYVREALRKDEDAHVRARAAAVSGGVPGLAGDLVAALDDAEPRVREAAIASVAEANARGAAQAPAAGLLPALGKRLTTDDWTFVRAGAARALGALPGDTAIDAALAAALRDRSPEVRGRALDALGAHRAKAHVDAIRARQDDPDEELEVRARAIVALGALCDTRSLDTWTKLAQGARQPLDDKDRRLGGPAVAALGDVHPKDLAERLAPLLDKDAPIPLREMAKAALAGSGTCR